VTSEAGSSVYSFGSASPRPLMAMATWWTDVLPWWPGWPATDDFSNKEHLCSGAASPHRSTHGSRESGYSPFGSGAYLPGSTVPCPPSGHGSKVAHLVVHWLAGNSLPPSREFIPSPCSMVVPLVCMLSMGVSPYMRCWFFVLFSCLITLYLWVHEPKMYQAPGTLHSVASVENYLGGDYRRS
jgi:hypothetical protein